MSRLLRLGHSLSLATTPRPGDSDIGGANSARALRSDIGGALLARTASWELVPRPGGFVLLWKTTPLLTVVALIGAARVSKRFSVAPNLAVA